MDRRLKLDEKLRELQNEVWDYQHTYFEPPEDVTIKYNAVIYERTGFYVRRADDKGYLVRDAYQVMIISYDPEDILPRKLVETFSHCSPGKFFVRDNLWHFPFTIYF